MVARDGRLVGLLNANDDPAAQIDLPIWCQGEIAAHYRLTLGQKKPDRDVLRVALSLADQAGAAMGGASQPVPAPPDPAPKLRLVQTGGQDQRRGT